MARTIESPGVQVNESDLTLRIEPTVGTNTWVLGYASQGPTEEPINITSFSDFESVYGVPTNAAERYFYHTCREYLNSGANLIATRIPYGDGGGSSYGEKYGALVYPVIPASSTYASNSAANATASTAVNLTAGSVLVFGEPQHVELTSDEYYDLINNNISWAPSATVATLSSGNRFAGTGVSRLSTAGMIVLDITRSMSNNVQEGYYIGIVDNQLANPTSNYKDVIGVKAVNSATTFAIVDSSRLTFSLSATYSGAAGSVSEILESIPNFVFDTNSFNDSIALGLFKVRKSIYSGVGNNALDKVLVETFVGSLDSSRKIPDSLGGPARSFFIEDVVNNSSSNLRVLVNPYISRSTTWLDASGNVARAVRTWKTTGETSVSSIVLPDNNRISVTNFAESRSLYEISTFATVANDNKLIGDLPTKLARVFACVSNPDLIPIDVTVDGGLSTIWATVKATSASIGSAVFDDTQFITNTAFSGLSSTDGSYTGSDVLGDAHKTIYNLFSNFAEGTRKDHIHITDPLRQLFVNGTNFKVFTSKCDRVNNPFSKVVYWPLRNLYNSANSSYVASYANWVRVYDGSSDNYCWVPFSGWAARAFAETDRDRFPWIAPAGLTRGLVRNVTDLAINPNQKERDLLYRIGQNPVCLFPNDGYVIWGQKTLFRKPSAFDRINVRRLFLALEKPTARVLKYFVFEPNTVFTRTQVVNVLTPLFENAKRNEGVYDYMIVCDDRNNTPDVIDRNELVIDIYLKPVRASEFILVNFIATRTNQDFAELI